VLLFLSLIPLLLSPLLFRCFLPTAGKNGPLSKVLIGIHRVAALAGKSGA